MGKNNTFSSKEQENAYYQEWAFVYARVFSLFLLAIGSLIASFKIGGYVGGLIFQEWLTGQYIVTNLFVFMTFLSIDWGLSNALSSASNSESSAKYSVWVYAVSAMAVTVALSIVSNSYVVKDMSGKSHLGEYNKTIVDAMGKDSALHMKAMELIEKAPEEESRLISEARRAGKQLIDEAVKIGSSSWQSDYQAHKNNPKAWFWTCQGCASEYRSYRDNIKEAKKEANKMMANAIGHSENLKATLAPTLSYSMQKDSTLLKVEANIKTMEAERLQKQKELNTVLLFLTVGCGILSFILTFVLKEHRKTFGQQIVEDHVRPVMGLLQLANRFVQTVINVFYSFGVGVYSALRFIGLGKRFELSIVTDSRKTSDSNVTVAKKTDTKKQSNRSQKRSEPKTDNQTGRNSGQDRKCLECETDISHKRSDAKFCSSKCRMKYHNYTPPGL